jgi:ABC-type uncharacterized transport system permease subunit
MESLTTFLIAFLMSSLRVSTPLILTSMGGLMSERSGVINIALEGFMIVGAFAGAAAASHFHSPVFGVLFGMMAGITLAVIYGFFVIHMKADQIVAGTAMNLLALGLVPLFSKMFFDSTGSTPALEMTDRLHWEPMLWGAVLVVAIHLTLKHTRFGLWLGFAGEHPEALSTAGISVIRMRWWGVLASGAFAGLGGVALSIFLSSSYSRGMIAGRGFMALAALIFGKWKPIPTALACIFFGLTDALQIRLQGVAIFGDQSIPVQFIQILPYAVTIFVLAGFVGRSKAPQALGQPWILLLAMGLGLSGLSSCTKTTKAPQTIVLGESEKETLAKGEIFNEMIQVIFETPLKDQNIYESYLGSFSQGASLEGVYNGLTHSNQYRELEKTSQPATAPALRFFSEQMSFIQKQIKTPMDLRPELAQPLAEVSYPTGQEIDLPKKILEKKSRQKSKVDDVEEISALFKNASFLTLKRILGDAALRLLSESAVDPLILSELYGKWSASLAERNVNFGLKLRNETNAEFHTAWAKVNPLDRLSWEVLNRIHRVMNHEQQ